MYVLLLRSSDAGVDGVAGLPAAVLLRVTMGGAGEYRFAADSRRSRAGRTRFAGVTSDILYQIVCLVPS